jgi:hypothetical protein
MRQVGVLPGVRRFPRRAPLGARLESDRSVSSRWGSLYACLWICSINSPVFSMGSDGRISMKVAIGGEQMSAITRHEVNKNRGLENRPQQVREGETGCLMAAFPIICRPRGRSKVREEIRAVTRSWCLSGAGKIGGSEQPQNGQLNTPNRGVERRAKTAGGRKHLQVTHFRAGETSIAGNPCPTRGSKPTEERTR